MWIRVRYVKCNRRTSSGGLACGEPADAGRPTEMRDGRPIFLRKPQDLIRILPDVERDYSPEPAAIGNGHMLALPFPAWRSGIAGGVCHGGCARGSGSANGARLTAGRIRSWAKRAARPSRAARSDTTSLRADVEAVLPKTPFCPFRPSESGRNLCCRFGGYSLMLDR